MELPVLDAPLDGAARADGRQHGRAQALEETPLTGGEAYIDLLGADLPAGVLQIAHGADAVGKALVRRRRPHRVHRLRAVDARSSPPPPDRLTRVILELGGKDPMIVLDDADLDRAARFAASNSFRNAGQVCVSTRRIYVPHAIADDFVERLVIGQRHPRRRRPR
ncbi:MAG: aldehyde dehydrogenase family protein [bacterium]